MCVCVCLYVYIYVCVWTYPYVDQSLVNGIPIIPKTLLLPSVLSGVTTTSSLVIKKRKKSVKRYLSIDLQAIQICFNNDYTLIS